ncbi:MAG: sporulation integral membrane protein YtvI [Ruminococcaceae bacterium]|nr:sporulation integral membrane protein YtvI [Oscillospiraceae bacterium]
MGTIEEKSLHRGEDSADMKIKTFVLRGIAALLVALFAAAAFKYVFPVVLPFAVAYLISCAIRPLAGFLTKKTRISERVWAVTLIIISVALMGALIWFLGSALVRELKEFVSIAGNSISRDESPVRQVSDKVMGLIKKVNILSDSSMVDIKEMQTTAVSKAVSSLTGAVAGIVKSAPAFVFFVVVMILSLFYFSCDFEGIKKEMGRFFPERIMKSLSSWMGIGICAVKRFAKAYLSLFCITFAVLTLGFFLIGTEYPFLAALLCAFVDILPVFGVGTVLVPWAAVLFLTGETARAVGTVILFAVLYVLRQILEPRIVGGAAGVHPILALFAVFLGFKLLGVGGMIAAPILLNAGAVFWEEKRKKLSSEVDKGE